MGAGWLGTVFVVLLAAGCGGRAAQTSATSAAGAGPSGDSSAGAPSVLPDQADAGPFAFCAGPSVACTFTPYDGAADLPPEQRWGTVERAHEPGVDPWANSRTGCPPYACGEVMLKADHSGCVTLATDSTPSLYGACLLKYMEQFSWPCASDQRLRFYESCTVR